MELVPLRYLKKNSNLKNAWTRFCRLSSSFCICHLREKEEDNVCDAKITDQLFLSDLDGTNSILPNFSS